MPSTLHHLQPPQQFYETGIISPIYKWGSRFEQVRELALGHSAGKWQIKGLNPGLCDSKVAFPLYLAHRGFFFFLFY